MAERPDLPERRSTRPGQAPPPSYTPTRAPRPRPGDTQPIVVGRPPVPRAAATPPAPPPPPVRPARAGAPPPPPPVNPRSPRPAPPPAARATGAPPPGPRAPSSAGRRRRTALLLVLAILLAWPAGLALWANGRIERVAAASGATDTVGTTYLIAGSDSRADGMVIDAETTGSRTDTIMLLQVPDSGPAALISLPRDTYVEIPGQGRNKLNAAFAFGGPPLLVATVEGLTGMTVDHYVEVGFGGVVGLVDAVGGVELCLDYDVADELSGLFWTAGCHVSDGPTALAFSRMRYADPAGDIGRTARQQQVVGAVVSGLATPATLVRPDRQVAVLRAGTDAVVVSDGTGLVDLARLALGFRAATGGAGVTGTPPIVSMNHQPGGVGSTVLLEEAALPDFFAQIRDGGFEPGAVVGGAP